MAPAPTTWKLSEIEAEIRDADPEERTRVRQERSRPAYDELVRWGDVMRPLEPPSSPMGAALRYLDTQQIPLRRFFDDGRIPIDNGIVERPHVRTVLTRKNLLFAGSDAGGERAAIAFTILG